MMDKYIIDNDSNSEREVHYLKIFEVNVLSVKFILKSYSRECR